MNLKQVFNGYLNKIPLFARAIAVYLVVALGAIQGLNRYPKVINLPTTICIIVCTAICIFVYLTRYNKGLTYKQRGVEPKVGSLVKVVTVNRGALIDDFMGFRIPGLDSMARRVDAAGATGVVQSVKKYSRVGSVATVYSQSDSGVHLGDFLLDEIAEA